MIFHSHFLLTAPRGPGLVFGGCDKLYLWKQIKNLLEIFIVILCYIFLYFSAP